MKPSEFQCAGCGEVYEKGCTDEEALAELARDFPGMSPDQMVILCDDCDKAVMARAGHVRKAPE